MSKEVYQEFPMMIKGTPTLRSTQDANGNKYYWKANEAVHTHIEPELSQIVGEKLNQNAKREDYTWVIYNALKEGKKISPEIFSEFANRYPDVAKQYTQEVGQF